MLYRSVNPVSTVDKSAAFEGPVLYLSVNVGPAGHRLLSLSTIVSKADVRPLTLMVPVLL